MAVAKLTPRPRGRRWSVLVPFIQKAEFDGLMQAGSFSLWESQPPDVAWTSAGAAMGAAPKYSPAQTQPIPPALHAAVARIEQRDMYQREYAAKVDVHIAMVPLASLVAPQAHADLDYVEELADKLRASPDSEADLNFAFPVGSISEPFVKGNTLVFNEQTANIFVNPIPQHRRVGEEIEVILRASPRPNYMFVAELGGRLILRNGVHKALAMIRAGRTVTPAVVGRATSLPELGLPPSSLLLHLDRPRPPLVAGFLQPLAVHMERRPSRTLTRVVIQVEPIEFPE